MLEKLLNKAWEGKDLRTLANAPVHALAGVSEGDAAHLKAAFGVVTVRDFAQLKYVRWAQAIVALADAGG